MKTCKFEGCGRPIVGRAAQAKFCKKCAPLANRASTHQSWLDNRDARKKYQNDRLDRLDPARIGRREDAAHRRAEIERLLASGMSQSEVARRLGITRQAVHGFFNYWRKKEAASNCKGCDMAPPGTYCVDCRWYTEMGEGL